MYVIHAHMFTDKEREEVEVNPASIGHVLNFDVFDSKIYHNYYFTAVGASKL